MYLNEHLFVDDVMLLESECSSDIIMTENELQEKFQDLKENEVVCIGAVDMTLSSSLTLNTNKITVRGQGQERTTIRCPNGFNSALAIRYKMFFFTLQSPFCF